MKIIMTIFLTISTLALSGCGENGISDNYVHPYHYSYYNNGFYHHPDRYLNLGRDGYYDYRYNGRRYRGRWHYNDRNHLYLDGLGWGNWTYHNGKRCFRSRFNGSSSFFYWYLF